MLNLGCSAAELVLDTTVRLPGDIPTLPDMVLAPSSHDYAQFLRKLFCDLHPACPRQQAYSKVFISPDFEICTHVFLRQDAIKLPLTPACNGTFEVLHCTEKDAPILLRGRQESATLNSLKPVFMESTNNSPPTEPPLIDDTGTRPVSGVTTERRRGT